MELSALGVESEPWNWHFESLPFRLASNRLRGQYNGIGQVQLGYACSQPHEDAMYRSLPIGIDEFPELRSLSECVYVDKTRQIADLCSLLLGNQPQLFLSRPRRFGKTLLLSTLQSLFLGNGIGLKIRGLEKKGAGPPISRTAPQYGGEKRCHAVQVGKKAGRPFRGCGGSGGHRDRSRAGGGDRIGAGHPPVAQTPRTTSSALDRRVRYALRKA